MRTAERKKRHRGKPDVFTCLEGFEPATFWFVAKHSIRLSYRHMLSLRTDNIIAAKGEFVNSFASGIM